MCRSTRLAVSIGLSAAAFLSFSVNSQEQANASTDTSQAPTARPQVLEEVLVRGQRMSEIEFDIDVYIRDFIDQVVALPPGGGHARWRYSVCPGIYNLDPTPAQYVADRIALLAREVGLKSGEPGCQPDIMIIFTVDADAVAANMVGENPRLFRPGGPVCCMQLGLDALDEFVASDSAVRWWHVSMPIDPVLGQRAIQLPEDGIGNYPVIAVQGPSRIHNGVIDKLMRAIVIVDATRLTGTSWQEIGDYLALISLAQVNPKADPSNYDSILNLFSNPAAYTGLTDWDVSYIRALYEINLERLPGLQENQLVDRMAKRERVPLD